MKKKNKERKKEKKKGEKKKRKKVMELNFGINLGNIFFLDKSSKSGCSWYMSYIYMYIVAVMIYT